MTIRIKDRIIAGVRHAEIKSGTYTHWVTPDDAAALRGALTAWLDAAPVRHVEPSPCEWQGTVADAGQPIIGPLVCPACGEAVAS